jgi:hypothetical protein
MTLSPLIAAISAQCRFVGFTSDKRPINPNSGETGLVNDPQTWGTYEQATNWARRNAGYVGFLTLQDVLVLDFDGAVHDGVTHPWVQERIEALGGETELSVSGTGVHITVPMNEQLRALLPTKRPITDESLSIERVDLITGNNAVILGTPLHPATRPLPDQQAAAVQVVQELLALPGAQRRRGRKRSTARAGRPRQREEIQFDRSLAVAARDRGWTRSYFTYLFIRRLDAPGTGFLMETDVLRCLKDELPSSYKHPAKAARRLVDQLVERGFVVRAPFGQTECTVLRLPSLYRIAQLLQTAPGETADIPLHVCLSKTPDRWLYLAVAATRDCAVSLPRPTSRAQRREMTHVGSVTQRKAERMAGVEVMQNWVVGSPPPGRPWKRLADGHTVYQISTSTRVHDRERLETHLVQRDDRRMYFYPKLDYGKDAVPPGGLWFIGPERLPNGTLVNLWEVR